MPGLCCRRSEKRSPGEGLDANTGRDNDGGDCPASIVERVKLACGDLTAAGSVQELTITATDSDQLAVAVTL